jgi:hypothetical protein
VAPKGKQLKANLGRLGSFTKRQPTLKQHYQIKSLTFVLSKLNLSMLFNLKGNQMDNLWEISIEIDEIEYRLSNIKDVLELVSQETNVPVTGCILAARDLLDVLCQRLQDQNLALLEIHRRAQKKAKK